MFQPGEKVRLKSGGPVMTVVKRGSDGAIGVNHDDYKCMWFDFEKGENKDWYFPEVALEAVGEPDPFPVIVSGRRR